MNNGFNANGVLYSNEDIFYCLLLSDKFNHNVPVVSIDSVMVIKGPTYIALLSFLKKIVAFSCY